MRSCHRWPLPSGTAILRTPWLQWRVCSRWWTLRSSPAPTAQTSANMNHGLAMGDAGWPEDLHALTTPWGFDPGSVTVPVELWHGALDHMVPMAHGQ